jgi:hypothetical protein
VSTAFRLAFVLACCAMIAGCGGAAQQEASLSPAPSLTQPPADGGYFTDPREIVAKSKGTIPCHDLEQTQNAVGAREQVTCSGGNIVIRVHENRQGVTGQIELMKLTGGDLLTGQNWTLNASPSILQAARQHLGGQVEHVSCVPPSCALEPSP